MLAIINRNKALLGARINTVEASTLQQEDVLVNVKATIPMGRLVVCQANAQRR